MKISQAIQTLNAGKITPALATIGRKLTANEDIPYQDMTPKERDTMFICAAMYDDAELSKDIKQASSSAGSKWERLTGSWVNVNVDHVEMIEKMLDILESLPTQESKVSKKPAIKVPVATKSAPKKITREQISRIVESVVDEVLAKLKK